MLYSRELEERINSRISKFVVEAMSKWGYNAFGIYEIVKEEIERSAECDDVPTADYDI